MCNDSGLKKRHDSELIQAQSTWMAQHRAIWAVSWFSQNRDMEPSCVGVYMKEISTEFGHCKQCSHPSVVKVVERKGDRKSWSNCSVLRFSLIPLNVCFSINNQGGMQQNWWCGFPSPLNAETKDKFLNSWWIWVTTPWDINTNIPTLTV